MKYVFIIISTLTAIVSLQAQTVADNIQPKIEYFANQLCTLPSDSALTAAEEWIAMLSDEELASYISCAEQLLYTPYSNYHQRILYRTMLDRVLHSSKDDVTMLRYRYQYHILCNNNEGEKATNFTFLDASNTKHELSDYLGEKSIIIFNDPECEECATLRRHIIEHKECGGVAIDSTTNVLVIYPDYPTETWYEATQHYPTQWVTGYSEDVSDSYDLRVLPAVYILDEHHTVIQRNNHTHLITLDQ
jgi:thioredoxin-related protein